MARMNEQIAYNMLKQILKDKKFKAIFKWIKIDDMIV